MRKILKQVTVTGADDSIEPKELVELSEKYPFVEFGILCSKNNEGMPRFPSSGWIDKLYNNSPSDLKLSMHLCGGWMRQILYNELPEIFNNWMKTYLDMFQRVQLNFHGESNKVEPQILINNLRKFRNKQIIFQLDIVNNNIFKRIENVSRKTGLNVAGLWDLSHGGGILPENWQLPIAENIGYAGGLSPENVKENLEKLCKIVGDTQIWVDAESHLRSNSNQLFDLDKVVKLLENSKDYVI